jgi:hypothetical protein
MWSAYQNKLFLVLIKAGYIMTIKIKLDWFHWSTCTKPRKWEVMVNCVIFYLCFYHFVLAFQNSSDSVIFFVLIFYLKTIIWFWLPLWYLQALLSILIYFILYNICFANERGESPAPLQIRTCLYKDNLLCMIYFSEVHFYRHIRYMWLKLPVHRFSKAWLTKEKRIVGNACLIYFKNK